MNLFIDINFALATKEYNAIIMVNTLYQTLYKQASCTYRGISAVSAVTTVTGTREAYLSVTQL